MSPTIAIDANVTQIAIAIIGVIGVIVGPVALVAAKAVFDIRRLSKSIEDSVNNRHQKDTEGARSGAPRKLYDLALENAANVRDARQEIQGIHGRLHNLDERLATHIEHCELQLTATEKWRRATDAKLKSIESAAEEDE